MPQHFKNYYIHYSFLLFYGGIFFAITQFEEPFDFIHHTMSQLGKPSRNPDFWWAYMVVASISGLALVPFYLNIAKLKNGDLWTDRMITAITYLGVFSGFALLATALVHADYRMPHKICGGIYFFSNALIVLIVCALIPRHPRIHKWTLALAIPCFVLNGMFLYSSGKMAWAEWLTVLFSYLLALYFTWLILRAKKSESPGKAHSRLPLN